MSSSLSGIISSSSTSPLRRIISISEYFIPLTSTGISLSRWGCNASLHTGSSERHHQQLGQVTTRLDDSFSFKSMYCVENVVLFEKTNAYLPMTARTRRLRVKLLRLGLASALACSWWCCSCVGSDGPCEPQAASRSHGKYSSALQGPDGRKYIPHAHFEVYISSGKSLVYTAKGIYKHWKGNSTFLHFTFEPCLTEHWAMTGARI